MENPSLENQLETLLMSEHFSGKEKEAIVALGSEAMKLIQQYATGSHPSGNSLIHQRSIVTLGYSGDQTYIKTLKKILRTPDPDTNVRAMHAMGRLGGAEACETICGHVLKESTNDPVKAHGVRALGRINSEDAQKALEVIQKEKVMSDYVMEEVADAMKKMDY